MQNSRNSYPFSVHSSLNLLKKPDFFKKPGFFVGFFLVSSQQSNE